MGLVDRLIAGRGERRAALASPSWSSPWASPSTASGATVTHDSALAHPAVWRACALIASSVAQLPLRIYRRAENGDAVEEPAHRLAHVLKIPNAEMTGLELREALQQDLCLFGNAFAQVERDRQGRVTSLWPLQARRMEITRNADLRLVYTYRTDATAHEFLHDPARPALLHLRAFSADGVVGRSPVTVAREAIGSALAADEYGARFFGNGAAPGGVLQGPRGVRLTDQAHQRLRASWSAAHRGASNAHAVALLEDGWTWSPISVGNRDSQWIESRALAVRDIARLFGVPPWMLFEMGESANYSNVEQQSLDFVRELTGWLRRWESQIDRVLLPRASPFFARHVVEGMLRSDIATRYKAHATARQWGFLSINDIRRIEGLASIGPDGDRYMEPLNMAPVGGAATTEAPFAEDDDQTPARILQLANQVEAEQL